MKKMRRKQCEELDDRDGLAVNQKEVSCLEDAEEGGNSLVMDHNVEEPAYESMQCTRPISLGDTTELYPCGKCLLCRAARAREWTIRTRHELATQNCGANFTTLTYSPENLPANASLDRGDLTRFFKRLRKRGYNFRYYASGEYGEKTHRPHYHVIIIWKDSENKLFRNVAVNSAWRLGSVDWKPCTTETIAYTASYIKKIDDISQLLYEKQGRTPPFNAMSKGMGKAWALAHAHELEKLGHMYYEGKQMAMPRYYTKLIDIPEEVKQRNKEERLKKELNTIPKRRLSLFDRDNNGFIEDVRNRRKQRSKNARAKLAQKVREPDKDLLN